MLKDERMPILEGQVKSGPMDCTITQLERYLRPEKIYELKKEKEALKT